MAQLPVLAVVGVDFGTTFSGLTFNIPKLGEADNILEVWEYPGSKHHARYPKTPTALLYDNSVPPRPIYWGWEAEDHRAENPAGYTKLFKLSLAPPKMKNAGKMFPTPPGVTPEQCIADYLRLMKEFALETLDGQKGLGKIPVGLTKDQILQQIQWSLTVPAIWEQAGKHAMRTAAQEAGMIASAKFPNASPLPLLICLEPEAASMYVARDKGFKDFMKPGDPYMILDIGGGTTDIAVHAFGDNIGPEKGKFLREVVAGSGALVGGSLIDLQFLDFAEEKIPDLEQFNAANPKAYQSFLNNWDGVKRAFRGDEENIFVELPAVLKKYWFKQNQEAFAADGLDAGDLQFTISNKEMREIFDFAVTSIVDLTIVQSKKVRTAGRPARMVVLVGGLSESPYIEGELRRLLNPHFERIFTPPNPGSAVAKGATVFGLGLIPPPVDQGQQQLVMPGRVQMTHRIARRTYAVDSVDGLFTWVKAGEAVAVNHVIEQYLVPDTAHQTDMTYEVFSTEDKNITKANSFKELSISLKLTPGKDRVYLSHVYFGDTTIRVEAVNQGDQSKVECKLKFDAGKQ